MLHMYPGSFIHVSSSCPIHAWPSSSRSRQTLHGVATFKSKEKRSHGSPRPLKSLSSNAEAVEDISEALLGKSTLTCKEFHFQVSLLAGRLAYYPCSRSSVSIPALREEPNLILPAITFLSTHDSQSTFFNCCIFLTSGSHL